MVYPRLFREEDYDAKSVIFTYNEGNGA